MRGDGDRSPEGMPLLKNDEVFWQPTASENAPYLSWGSSGGDFAALWDHTRRRWNWIVNALAEAGMSAPRGRVIEFGSGMGLLDDLIDDPESRFTMLDHTSDFIAESPRPLSPRCHHVLWSSESLEMLHAAPERYDWLLSIAVFYHVDDVTAAALILELGALLRPGGHVLIEGFTPATATNVRADANRSRLFLRYPTYTLNLDLLRDALAPEYEELRREGVLLYRKRG